MRLKRLASLLLVCMVCLSGCTSTGLPITESEPSVTLPPAAVRFVAPIGDAALEYTDSALLHLPGHDGISLKTVETRIVYSPVRPKAESLVRALLAYDSGPEAASLGGDVHLSLYGATPVEVSRDVATVNLSPSALQLDREALYMACQAIANTLTQLPEINAVNLLVAGKPAGLDIANTLPMGALRHSTASDLGAVYRQLLSRRVESTESGSKMPFSANVTLYFPLAGTSGLVSEVRSMSFENQLLSDMVSSILRELASGPADDGIRSPELPLLGDLLTTTPTLTASAEAGGNILALDFAHNLYDMLEAYGISFDQSMASLCCTFSTFLPNLAGVNISVNGTPVDSLLRTEDTADEAADGNTLLRSECTDRLMDYCTLYFASEDGSTLCRSLRPVPYHQRTNPRSLLMELALGPQPFDSSPNLSAVMSSSALSDTDMLGLSLSEQTILVNFAPSFAALLEDVEGNAERMLAYSLVNTLCMDSRIRSVCFFQSGEQFEGVSGTIYWAGLFYPLPL